MKLKPTSITKEEFANTYLIFWEIIVALLGIPMYFYCRKKYN